MRLFVVRLRWQMFLAASIKYCQCTKSNVRRFGLVRQTSNWTLRHREVLCALLHEIPRNQNDFFDSCCILPTDTVQRQLCAKPPVLCETRSTFRPMYPGTKEYPRKRDASADIQHSLMLEISDHCKRIYKKSITADSWFPGSAPHRQWPEPLPLP